MKIFRSMEEVFSGAGWLVRFLGWVSWFGGSNSKKKGVPYKCIQGDTNDLIKFFPPIGRIVDGGGIYFGKNTPPALGEDGEPFAVVCKCNVDAEGQAWLRGCQPGGKEIPLNKNKRITMVRYLSGWELTFHKDFRLALRDPFDPGNLLWGKPPKI